MKTSELLAEAKKLIELPENWTTGAWARTLFDEDVSPISTRATCWCAYGALSRAADDRQKAGEYTIQSNAGNFMQEAARKLSNGLTGNVISFNDSQGHEKVLELFDEAIRLAKEKGE